MALKCKRVKDCMLRYVIEIVKWPKDVTGKRMLFEVEFFK